MLAEAANAPPTPRTEPHALPLLDFVHRATPNYLRPSHLAPIAAELERTEGEPVRAIVNAPPRHGKTELLLHFVAWYLARHPDRTVGYASHSAALAWSKSRNARDYARAAGVTLRDDANSMHEWRTTRGGGCLAAGIGGSWTGHGVHVLLVDDPYADRADAESPLIRSRVVDWYQSVANTRVEPGGSIVVSHTRWHEHDLSGWILRESDDRGDYVERNLPALDGDGHALWPARWPAAALERKRRGVGPYEWAALYLGNPIPKGGAIFRPPTHYEAPATDGVRYVIGCDPAGSEDARADHTAAVVLAVTGRADAARADVVEVVRFQKETPAAAAELERLQRAYLAPLHIEASRDGKSIARALRLINPRLTIVETPATASKWIRAQPVAGAWNEGRVRVPPVGAAPWLDEFVYELSKFTGVNDKHDDQVDALAYAWNAAATPVARRELSEEPWTNER